MSRTALSLLSLLALAACRDITIDTRATLSVTEVPLVAFLFRGSPLGAVSALDTRQPAMTRAEPVHEPFDVVFDSSGGEVRLFPVQLVIAGGGSPFHSHAALQLTTAPFDSIAEAPTTGYQDTASVAIRPGDVVLIRAASTCRQEAAIGRDMIFSRILIQEITTFQGYPIVKFRIRTNPNCGFRSFKDGIPEF